MPENTTSVQNITVPLLYVFGMVTVIAASAAFHVKMAEMKAELKSLQLQRDKISEIQSAVPMECASDQ